MKKVFGVIKINILSLIALPLLLLAVSAKLLAKALEKVMVAIGSVVILLLAMLVASIIQRPGETLNVVLIVIVVLVIGGIITLIVMLIFSVISSLVMAVTNFVIGILNGIYELLYGGYSSLFHKCKKCYEQELGETGNPFVKGLMCLIYSILRVINTCIIFFVTHALKLIAVACVLLIVGTFSALNHQTQAIFGLNVFTVLGMFPTRDVIAGAVLYAAFILCTCTIMISLGLEWNEWGEEMKMATGDYDQYMASLAQTGRSLDDSVGDGEENEAVIRCREYIGILNRHFAEAEEFQAETQIIIQRSENQALRSLLGEYMSKAVELSEKMNSLPDRIPVEEFEKLIPQIKRLDSLKEDIRKLNVKMASVTPAATGGGFFAGCDNLQKLEKRYKALCKTYHPDSEAGDEETFKKMQEEYEELKGKLQ